MNAVPVRFFTASGLLMRLRRAKQENRLDRELAGIGKARLLIIDEFGYMPVDEEGSRLLFQVISDSYETRSIIHATNIEFSGWGRVLGDKNMAAALIDAPSTTQAHPFRGQILPQRARPHDQINQPTTGRNRRRAGHMPNMRKTRCRNRGNTLLIMRTSTCQNTAADAHSL